MRVSTEGCFHLGVAMMLTGRPPALRPYLFRPTLSDVGALAARFLAFSLSLVLGGSGWLVDFFLPLFFANLNVMMVAPLKHLSRSSFRRPSMPRKRASVDILVGPGPEEVAALFWPAIIRRCPQNIDSGLCICHRRRATPAHLASRSATAPSL